MFAFDPKLVVRLPLPQILLPEFHALLAPPDNGFNELPAPLLSVDFALVMSVNESD